MKVQDLPNGDGVDDMHQTAGFRSFIEVLAKVLAALIPGEDLHDRDCLDLLPLREWTEAAQHVYRYEERTF